MSSLEGAPRRVKADRCPDAGPQKAVSPPSLSRNESWLDDGDVRLYLGDCREVLRSLPAESVQTCVTSPPYFGLRDYGHEGQIGLEASPDEFVAALVETFREVRRVLRDDGTLWLNLGDSYAGGGGGNYGGDSKSTATHGEHVTNVRNRGDWLATAGVKAKDLLGIPWLVAFALRADGWYLRSDVIWAKPNPMPESVTDRPTRSHEYLFLLSKSARYFYDADAVRESAELDGQRGTTNYSVSKAKRGAELPGAGHVGLAAYRDNGGRNKRSVWTVTTQPYPGAHFATFPPKLIEPCVLAGCPEGGTVLDPFSGSGTTAWVARHHGRQAIGIDLSEDYLKLAAHRLQQLSLIGDAA